MKRGCCKKCSSQGKNRIWTWVPMCEFNLRPPCETHQKGWREILEANFILCLLRLHFYICTRYEKNLCKWVMLWKICLLSLLLRSLTTAFLRFLSGYDKNSHFHFAAAASFTVFEHISNLLILYEIQKYNFSILSSSENRRTLLKSRNGSI